MPTAVFTPGDEKLKFMFEYWMSKRHGGLLPTRRDIDILDLRPMIGGIHMIDASSRDPSNFVFRVTGQVSSRVDQGQSYVNKTIANLPSEAFRKSVIEDYGAVAFTGTPAYHHVVALLDFIKYSYSRLVLPLADDGRQVNMLMTGVVKRRFDDLTVG